MTAGARASSATVSIQFIWYILVPAPSCKCIWTYQTSKVLARYILSSVSLRSSQFSQLSFMQYMGLCVFSLPISLMIIERICALYLIIIIELEVLIVCLSIFTWTCLPFLTYHGLMGLALKIVIVAPITDLLVNLGTLPLVRYFDIELAS